MKKLIMLFVLCLLSGSLFSGERSPEWTELRNRFVHDHPVCVVCGSESDIQVHHLKTFKLWPGLELDYDNLVTLCISKRLGFNCHLEIGHGGSYKYYNPYIKDDITSVKTILDNCSKESCRDEVEEYLKFARKETRTFNTCMKRYIDMTPDEAEEYCKR